MKQIKDRAGEKYGRLTVVNFVKIEDKKTYWSCKCDCGNVVVKPISYLVAGNCKSCGCLNAELSRDRLKKIKEKGNSKSLVDLTGKKFGRLTVVKRVENNKFKQVQWLCKCECGKEKIICGNSLKDGSIKSCGCLKKEQDYINIAHITHDKSNTRLYNIWRDMKWRCSSAKSKRHKFYHDKGIKVCNEWAKDFMSFYNWAINNGYHKDLTLDRINNDGNYEPSNCRWATITEQNNNQSNNIKIKYNNKSYTLKELSKKFNIKNATLYDRLRRGWSIEKTLNTPVQTKIHRKLD